MAKQITVSRTELTIVTGRMKTIRVNVDGVNVDIPVEEDVYAYFNEQFRRNNPTAIQKRKFTTIKNLLRAAYLKGVEDGQKNK